MIRGIIKALLWLADLTGAALFVYGAYVLFCHIPGAKWMAAGFVIWIVVFTIERLLKRKQRVTAYDYYRGHY